MIKTKAKTFEDLDEIDQQLRILSVADIDNRPDFEPGNWELIAFALLGHIKCQDKNLAREIVEEYGLLNGLRQINGWHPNQSGASCNSNEFDAQ